MIKEIQDLLLIYNIEGIIIKLLINRFVLGRIWLLLCLQLWRKYKMILIHICERFMDREV
jgi:hypothetical protein